MKGVESKVLSAKMAQQGTSEVLSWTKAINKLAKTFKINFLGTLDTNQKLVATRRTQSRKKA